MEDSAEDLIKAASQVEGRLNEIYKWILDNEPNRLERALTAGLIARGGMDRAGAKAVAQTICHHLQIVDDSVFRAAVQINAFGTDLNNLYIEAIHEWQNHLRANSEGLKVD